MSMMSILEGLTREKLQKVVTLCKSRKQVLEFLGIMGRNGRLIQKVDELLVKHKIDTSHFGKKAVFDLTDVLIETSTYNNQTLKKRLIKEKLIKYECVMCENKGIWNGKPLVLQLDHINGKKNDNRFENLRLLCPNCHSQTETFGGRNQ